MNKKFLLGCWFLFQSCIAFSAGTVVNGNLEVYQVISSNEGVPEKIVAVNGGEVDSGSLLQYVLTFTNKGDSDASGLIVHNPIPQSVVYQVGSNSTTVEALFEVSIDGGELYESEPVNRTEVDKAGKKRQIVIPPDQYTNVRWVVSEVLVPTASQVFKFRVLVE